MEVDLMQEFKEQQNNKCKNVSILFNTRGQDKGLFLWEQWTRVHGFTHPLSQSMVVIML